VDGDVAAGVQGFADQGVGFVVGAGVAAVQGAGQDGLGVAGGHPGGVGDQLGLVAFANVCYAHAKDNETPRRPAVRGGRDKPPHGEPGQLRRAAPDERLPVWMSSAHSGISKFPYELDRLRPGVGARRLVRGLVSDLLRQETGR